MKRTLILATALLTSAVTFAQSTWKSDAGHANLGFIVTHLNISELPGSFTEFESTITSSKTDFSDAQITLTAKTASIKTGVEGRDNHLKSADFFDAEKNPEITFKSTAFKKGKGKNMYVVTGELTMHGVTKTVSFDVTYKGTTANPMSKKDTASFLINGSVKRSEFGIGKDMPNDIVGDVVKLWASIEFVKQ